MANIVKNRVTVIDASPEEITKIFEVFKQHIPWKNTITQVDNTLLFETAWSNLKSIIIENISYTFNTELHYTFAEESALWHIGDCICKNGKFTHVEQPATQSLRAYEIFFEMWPGWKELYIFDGTIYQRDWDKE